MTGRQMAEESAPTQRRSQRDGDMKGYKYSRAAIDCSSWLRRPHKCDLYRAPTIIQSAHITYPDHTNKAEQDVFMVCMWLNNYLPRSKHARIDTQTLHYCMLSVLLHNYWTGIFKWLYVTNPQRVVILLWIPSAPQQFSVSCFFFFKVHTFPQSY